jgi:hypothetical protein
MKEKHPSDLPAGQASSTEQQSHNITNRKTGQEYFHLNSIPLPINLLNFWQWSASDLLTNTNRGRLAEFIVASALGKHNKVKEEWLPYDLITDSGIKLEIKSSAYLQSWHQNKLSRIIIDISPKRSWDPSTNKLSSTLKRNSDVYIFCLQNHKNIESLDIFNISQWHFYILSTSILNDKLPNQKSISLISLQKLKPIFSTYNALKASIEKCLNK